MKLRNKVLLIIGIVFVCLIVIQFLTSQAMLIGGLSALERRDIQAHVQRAKRTLDQEIANLDTVTRDWAFWDDTYAFIRDHNTAYAKANLTPSSLSGIRLNVIMFLDREGVIVAGTEFDYAAERALPLSKEMRELPAGQPFPYQTGDASTQRTGIFMSAKGPLLFAMRPILTSEGTGPSRGALIMGRSLNSVLIKRLGEQINLPLNVYSFTDPRLPADVQAVRPRLSGTVVEPLGPKVIAGYALLRDMYDRPSLILRIETPREMYHQGRLGISVFIVSLILGALISGVVILVLMESLILARMRRITSRVGLISASGDLSQRIAIPGADELTRLAGSINAMLVSLEGSDKALKESEEKYRNLVERANDGIAIIQDQRLVFVNSRLAGLCEYTVEELTGAAFVDLFDTQEASRAIDRVQRRLQGEDVPRVYETTLKDKLGRSMKVEFNADTIPYQGRPAILAFIRDITERIRSEEALRQSEDRYRLLIQELPIGIYRNLPGERGEFILVNQAMAEILGYDDMEELLAGGAVGTYADPSEREALLDELLTRGEVVGYEIHLKKRNGDIIWCTISARTVRDKTGNVRYFDGMLADITERKRSETAVNEANERYRALFGRSLECVFIHDLSGMIMDVNESVLNILGYAKTEIIGLPFTRLLGTDQVPLFGQRIEEIKATGTQQDSTELCMFTKAGEPLYMETRGALLFRDGRPFGIQTVARDVTVRKVAEETLRQSEEKYRTILEGIEDGYYELDLSGRITFLNDALCSMSGYARDELIGKSYLDLMDEESARTGRELVRGVFATGESVKVFDWTMVRKDGEKSYVDSSISLMKDAAGKPRGWRGIIRDITNRVLTEVEYKRAKEEAEAANRAKSDFLANMSHEIRTPMNGIIGMMSLLQDTKLDGEQHEYATMVQHSADALLTIINDILDFSKIEAGKLDLDIIDFDIRLALDEVADLLALKAQEKGLEFACMIHHDVPALVRGDPGRLRQILINLAGNAVKFTDKGEVVIRARLEDETDTHVTIRFMVSDTGIGIPAEKMDRLFQWFSQIDSSRTRRYGGTGLGLAISHQLAEMMGGRIGVESVYGQGSTFWFTSVLEKQPQTSAIEQIPHPTGIRGQRILVVDRNETNRDILKLYLESWGCRFDEALSDEEAVRKLREAHASGDPFRVALLQMQMPGMGGEALGRLIKLEETLKDTILMMLTEVGKRGDVSRLRDIGFSAYLTKPIKRSQLYNSLVKILIREGEAPEAKLSAIITRHSLNEERKHGIRILLAEDNEINRTIALKILEKLGYKADAVCNGREAVAALEKRAYAVVLMDVQMPEMDGFEATGIIRDPRSAVVDHRIPIIAMTAHAMKGDREHCLEVGMDDYLAKPIQPEELASVIERWLTKILSKEAPLPEPTPAEIFDRETFLKRLAGDEAFMREILARFLDDFPKQLHKLHAAVLRQDAQQTARLAHILKGAAGNINAAAVRAVVLEIERMGTEGDWRNADIHLEQLRNEYNRLRDCLVRYSLSGEPNGGVL